MTQNYSLYRGEETKRRKQNKTIKHNRKGSQSAPHSKGEQKERLIEVRDKKGDITETEQDKGRLLKRPDHNRGS